MKPRRSRHPASALTALAVLASCGSDALLRVIPEPDVGVDTHRQRSAAVVDVLWVIDSSGSMQNEQDAVAGNLDRFIEGLALCRETGVPGDLCGVESRTCSISGAACLPTDYHLGVTTMDLHFDEGRLHGVSLCVPAAGEPPAGGKYRWCDGAAECGAGGDPDADPANPFCDLARPTGVLTASTPNLLGAFRRAVRVGIGGSPQERGLQAAARALGQDVADDGPVPLPPGNEGFLREDAALFVVFLTDEEDASQGQVPYYARLLEGLKGPGNERRVSVSAIVGDPDPDGPGPEVGSCGGDGGDLSANSAGMRYVALAMLSRGAGGGFRVCDDALPCGGALVCSRPIPDLPGLCLPDRACSDDPACAPHACRNRRCVATPASLRGVLEEEGAFASICSESYSDVLDRLGLAGAGLARKFPLTRWPDCSRPVPCGDGPPRDLCVLVAGSPVARHPLEGFTYDPIANAVFFGGAAVPAPEATVELRYTVNELAEPGCAP